MVIWLLLLLVMCKKFEFVFIFKVFNDVVFSVRFLVVCRGILF